MYMFVSYVLKIMEKLHNLKWERLQNLFDTISWFLVKSPVFLPEISWFSKFWSGMSAIPWKIVFILRQCQRCHHGDWWLIYHLWRCWTVPSYMLNHEYRVARNRYSQLLFTSEDCFCANLHVQQQSANMTSQCQYPTFVCHHRSTVVTSQYLVRKDHP